MSRSKRSGDRLEGEGQFAARDDDDEEDSAGTWNKASSDVLAKRRIISVSRKKMGGGGAAPPAGAPGATSNPFGGFAGLTGAAAATAPAPSNPFGGFTFASGSNAPGKTVNAAPTAAAPRPFSYAGLGSSAANGTKPPPMPGAAHGAAPSDPGSSEGKMKRLNVDFAKWLTQQANSKPDAMWKGGVADYVRYASELAEKIAEEKKTPGRGDGGGARPFPAPSTAPVAATVPAALSTAAPFGSSFGLPPKPAAPPAAAPPAFSFGAKPADASAPPAAAPPAFSFGAAAKLPGASAFSFGAMTPKPPAAGGGGGGDDEDAVPPEEVEVVEKSKDEMDREVVFETRAKLLRLGDERDQEGKKTGKQEWKEMGSGNFQLLRGRLDEKRYLLLRDEKLGKLRLNVLVSKHMKFTKGQGKGGSVRFFATLMEPELDDAGKMNHDKLVPSNVLLNLKVPKEKADEALEKLQAATPK